MNLKSSRQMLGLCLIAFAVGTGWIKADDTWDGGAGNGFWDSNGGLNWQSNTVPNSGENILFFNDNNNGQTNMTDFNVSFANALKWFDTQSWTLNQGNVTLNLFQKNDGTQSKIENFSTGTVTINLHITFAANGGNNWGEINAVGSGGVGGSITFGSSETLTVNGSGINGIRLFGGTGATTTFNNTVSASGKYFSTSSVGQTMAVGGSFTSGDIYLMNNSTLKLNSGGSISTSALRLGGDFGTTGTQDQTKGATFALTEANGSQSFSSTVNTVTGNTSGALLIDSQNTSGTNTISSSVFLDSDLKTQTAAGGTLLYQGGSFDIKNRTLTVSGSGNTTVNEVLGSSFGAGGSLVKTGGGTLILQSTSNDYTGTSTGTLNANGTQISGGVLGIYGDGSLGLAPASAYNNIQFTGSGTLQDTANNISLASTRNISVATNATATFDSNGNTFTINGSINGNGNILKSGAGTVVLTTSNSYFGTTTVSDGTLKLANPSGVAIAGGGNVFVNRGGTLLFGGNNQINQAVFQPIAIGGGAGTPQAKIDAGGFSQGTGGTPVIPSSGTIGLGALTLNSSSIIDLTSTSVLHFADSSANSWTGTLSIYDWTGSTTGGGAEQILFGQTVTGLNAGQLGQIQFYSDAGNTALGSGALILADGEIIPNLVAVPEASTWLAGGLAILGVIFSQRRRLRAMVSRKFA